MLARIEKGFLLSKAVVSVALTVFVGACHYLTNRFQMKAPVAPSRSLREASVGMAEGLSARDVFMKGS